MPIYDGTLDSRPSLPWLKFRNWIDICQKLIAKPLSGFGW